MVVTLILALMLSQTAAPETRGDDIIVTARRRHCDINIAGRVIDSAEFRARADQWRAGRPVRVVVPAEARVSCLAKIMFRLADHGVTRAEFVDQAP